MPSLDTIKPIHRQYREKKHYDCSTCWPQSLERSDNLPQKNYDVIDYCSSKFDKDSSPIKIYNCLSDKENDTKCNSYSASTSRHLSYSLSLSPPSLESDSNMKHGESFDDLVEYSPKFGRDLGSLSSVMSKSDPENRKQFYEDKNENSNLSWISRSLCGIHSASTLQSIDDETSNTSFHSTASFTNNDVGRPNTLAQSHEEAYTACESRIISADSYTCTMNQKEGNTSYLACSKSNASKLCDCLKQVVDYSRITEHGQWSEGCRMITEDYTENELDIGNLLDENGLWCNSWQDWYTIEDGNDQFDLEDSARVIQNRAFDLGMRRRRLHRLQINLRPFEFPDEELDEGAINRKRYMQITPGKRVHSFSEISPKSVLSTPNITNTAASQKSFRWDSINCGEEKVTREMNKVNLNETEEEDPCYDSDPSEMIYAGPIANHNATEFERGLGKFSDASTTSLNSTASENIYAASFTNMCDLMNTRKILVWHGNENDSPVAVKAWVELGTQLQTALIQPKFMWHGTLGKDKHEVERRVLNKLTFHSLELLDITKVVPTEHINRKRYPFAKRSHSFLIQAFSKEMLFEAISEKERDDIVDGLKMTVARLGSKILVGDGRVLNEFFTPTGASVPGEPPCLAMEWSQAGSNNEEN